MSKIQCRSSNPIDQGPELRFSLHLVLFDGPAGKATDEESLGQKC